MTSAAETEQVIEFLKEKMYLGWLIESLAGLTSIFSMSVAFTFLYMALPNTRTRFVSALLGGILAGVLWVGAMTLHVRFQVGIANFNAIYSGFAAVPIFLAWVQVSWVIVLLGAEMAFAHQSEPAYRQIAQVAALGPRLPRDRRVACDGAHRNGLPEGRDAAHRGRHRRPDRGAPAAGRGGAGRDGAAQPPGRRRGLPGGLLRPGPGPRADHDPGRARRSQGHQRAGRCTSPGPPWTRSSTSSWRA